MKAQVVSVYSSDIDIDTYVSEDPLVDGQWIRFMVGSVGSIGSEAFDVIVCTPQWLAQIIAKEGPQIGRHHVIVESFDVPTAINFITQRIEELERDDWHSLGERIGWIGMWTEDPREYER